MKLRELEQQTIHRTGIEPGKRTAFRMNTGKKAFKIMSSTIYKYKIRAIIRELSCNAIDGHIAAGNLDSFDVQLPTIVDPRFIIRDYGTGLSDQMVTEVFTVYFESTKTDSNDMIGALGLGSKSPFCYTTTFTVESIQNGVKRGYTAYMDEGGEPFIDPLYTTETNEPDGVQITVPVKIEDIEEWEKEACRVYEPFTKIRPRFIGVQVKINWQPEQSEGLIKYKTKNYSGLYARMGNICYPIDADMFEGSLFECYKDSAYAYILDFPLGELDFMPSREELSLDKITKKAIVDRLSTINTGFYDLLFKQFSSKITVRQKIAWYYSLPGTVQTWVTRNPNFRVGTESLYEIRTSIEESSYLPTMNVWGYWANAYDSKSCSYEKVGNGTRYAKYKPETTTRQDIKRVLLPWDQDKLYIITPDVEKIRPYIMGYAIKKDSRVNFITDSTNQDLELLIKIGRYEESEIVRIKASELVEEKAIYEESRRKYKETYVPSASEPRPKTPTAYRYTIDKKRNLHKESLFLTKAQFVELGSSYAIKLYGLDEYSSLSSCPGFNIDSVMQSIHRVMVQTGLNEVYVIRNSLWNKIEESKMSCLVSFVRKQLIDAISEISPNGYPSFIGYTHRSNVRSLKDFLKFELKVKNQFNEKLWNKIDVLQSLTATLSEVNKNDKELAKSVKKHLTMSKNMQKRVDEAYDKFKKVNPVIDHILDNKDAYYMRKLLTDVKMTENIVSLIR